MNIIKKAKKKLKKKHVKDIKIFLKKKKKKGQKTTPDRQKSLSKDEKGRKCQFHRDRNKNFLRERNKKKLSK